MGAAGSRPDDEEEDYSAQPDIDAHGNQPINQPINNQFGRSGLLGTETLMIASSTLSFTPKLGRPPFPHFTQSQLQSLKDNDVDLDLCFQPYQMPRLPRETWQRPVEQPLDPSINHSAPVDQSNNQTVNQSVKKFAYINSTMNVRKDSITISSSKILNFIVDVDLPCRIRVYIGAYQQQEQDESTNQLSNQPMSHEPRFECHARTNYQTVNLESSHNQTISIDLKQLADESVWSINQSTNQSMDELNLFQQTRHFWPLIIHLDDTTIRDRYDDQEPKSIDHMILYCVFNQSINRSVNRSISPTANSVTSQPTDQSINPSSPDLAVQVVKRVALCGPARFELGEVYVDETDCVICLTSRRTHVIYPCRHLCLCRECAVQLYRQSTRCPICRKIVQSTFPVLPGNDEAINVD